MAEPWVLVLGTADWDQPIATNQHFAARELAREFRVTFVESLGLRRPQLSARDLQRVRRRLTRGRTAPGGARRDRPPGLDVVSPVILPYHRGPSRAVNRRVLHRSVAPWVRHPGPRVLWTYSPETYGLESVASGALYHCVDLLAEVAGISATVVERGERRLVGCGARAAATSDVVHDHLRRAGFADVLRWPNVADVAVFRDGSRTLGERHPGRAVFAGNLTASKVDFALLERLAGSGTDVHLAGPVAQGGGSAGAELRRTLDAGATYHGMLEPEQLADLYRSASVGLIPYLSNPYTRGVDPLKTYEYLAAGLAVVSTPLPSVREVDGDVVVRPADDGYVDAVARYGSEPDAAVRARRLALAEEHSWERRGTELRAVARELVAEARR
ncbi:glycosyltransferase [Cellulomonas sp.]|uniref:glycosyltransferase n=1 Tax=Cellulomonas sp. TaxID=40001 RepID=UPI001B2CD320|nr:glycosyltransferase [Cellulomonas sp.]MBO9553127.1 glycosyltransferase [Cellulomonas sp.]